jgi:hypothetical protein
MIGSLFLLLGGAVLVAAGSLGFLSGAAAVASSAAGAVSNAWGAVSSGIGNFAGTVSNGLGNLAGAIVSRVSSLWGTVSSGVANIWGSVNTTINSVLGSAGTFISNIFSSEEEEAEGGEEIIQEEIDAIRAQIPIPSAEEFLQAVEIENGHLTEASIEKLANLATINSEAGTVTLGRFAENYDVAGFSSGNTIFDMGEEGWNTVVQELNEAGMTENEVTDEMWKINQQVIDNQISAGKAFEFTSDPRLADSGTYTGKEFDEILNSGKYTPVYQGKTLVGMVLK